MEIKDLYDSVARLIHENIRKEIVAQGHHLTGAMEDSLDHKTVTRGKSTNMEGTAIGYTRFVNDGFPAKSASFKQVPFLVEYFKKRGFAEQEATSIAFATIKTWMKEGMPTQASKRFSSTGSRTNMIENSFAGSGHQVDEAMSLGLDHVVHEQYRKEKSETI